jgi:glycosidase
MQGHLTDIRRFTIFMLYLLLFIPSLAQVSRVDPANWWVGMKDPRLQLMVYGNGIGETVPRIRYSGVTVKKVHKADSRNYLFIDLNVEPNTKPGTLTIEFLREGRVAHEFSYSLLPRRKPADAYQGFSSADVICLITPDRFVNGDETNDIINGMRENAIDRSSPGARHGGDIRGIINSLGYLADMGFTAIWPQPMLENDMKAYSYHGYAITDHYKVDPRFGTLDEYRELAQKASSKGIKLIFDGVVNHIGSNHWWMKDKPFRDWLNFPDSLVLTNHRRTVNQDPYASGYDRNLMSNGWFDVTMPDMNNRNPFMAEYLIQHTIWWTETLQLGGIRQDTYGYSDKEFLRKWSCRMMQEYPNFNIVGEEWSLNPLVTSYWQQGKKNADGYESCLRTVMDFPLQSALVRGLLEKEERYGFDRGLGRLYEALANDFVYPRPGDILVFGDNHDMDRIFTQLGNDIALTKMAMTFLLTVRGIPQVYYGTEILMQNSAHPNDHGVIRSDLPGGWKADTASVFTGKGLSAGQQEMQTFLRRLLNWRKSSEAIAKGRTMHFAPFNGVYVYFRYTDIACVMVIMNKNNAAVQVDTKRFEEILGTRSSGYDVMTGRTLSLKDPINIPARTATVLTLN